MVRTVDLELVDPLLKVLVLEVVEIGRAAVGTGCRGGHAPLNTVLAVVLAAADNLHWLSEHFGAELADQFCWDLARKIERIAIVLQLWAAVHCHYLWARGMDRREMMYILSTQYCTMKQNAESSEKVINSF